MRNRKNRGGEARVVEEQNQEDYKSNNRRKSIIERAKRRASM
jgi:hypothetical protein